jgi:hypothetical protein
VLIVGGADWGTAPDPLTTTMTTGTAEVELRALRLDAGKVLTTRRGSGRDLDATEQMARTKAIRKAVTQIVEQSEFVGALANNWNEEPWSARGYFKPDPGSPGAALAAPTHAERQDSRSSARTCFRPWAPRDRAALVS